MDNDLKTKIDEYLSKGKLLQLATSSHSGLWMCHVWYAYDPVLNQICFTSNKTRRHSIEIIHNPVVSGGVIAIDLVGLGQKVQGISFEGSAKVANTESEIERAYNLYAQKWDKIKSMFGPNDIITGATNMRMFIVSLKRIVYFDEVNFPDNPRQELIL